MLNDFDFVLPQDLIAQYPPPRGQSKLLHIDRDGKMTDRLFNDIEAFLRPGDVVILNNTKVIPALLHGYVDGRRISINLINKCQNTSVETWEILSKPRKKLQLGSIVHFSDELYGVIIEKYNVNDMDIIEFNLSEEAFYALLPIIGCIPLPPYIKRPPEKSDTDKYQTVFAEKVGSVAAPTAGLHFTNELLENLQTKGINISYVTLHIGGGTFLPVKRENILEHNMHSEFYSIDAYTCNLINEAKKNGHKVIAIGTTAARALESAANHCDEVLQAHSCYTRLFITPGYAMKIVDSLITNFHLPKSTLFMLVCALLGGVEAGQKLYSHAIINRYNFFSFGDACFIEK